MIKLNNWGRLGNRLLQNIGASILSKKFNMKVELYDNTYNFDCLGLQLYNGERILHNIQSYTDNDVMLLLNLPFIENGISFDGGFQLKDFVLNYKNEILNHFNLTYNDKSNDLFIHVRLDDATHVNAGIEYYRKAINSISFNHGYISSDTSNHPMVQTLIKEFNLTLYNNNPINTINFGKDFGNIILSKGTFSWFIGLLSKAKNIIYPINTPAWHGDIFVYPEWKGLN